MRNGSKLEQILWDRGESLKELGTKTSLSYPTLVSINKGRIKKYHETTLNVLCTYLSTSDKKLGKEDILGFVESFVENKVEQNNGEQNSEISNNQIENTNGEA